MRCFSTFFLFICLFLRERILRSWVSSCSTVLALRMTTKNLIKVYDRCPSNLTGRPRIVNSSRFVASHVISSASAIMCGDFLSYRQKIECCVFEVSHKRIPRKRRLISVIRFKSTSRKLTVIWEASNIFGSSTQLQRCSDVAWWSSVSRVQLCLRTCGIRFPRWRKRSKPIIRRHRRQPRILAEALSQRSRPESPGTASGRTGSGKMFHHSVHSSHPLLHGWLGNWQKFCSLWLRVPASCWSARVCRGCGWSPRQQSIGWQFPLGLRGFRPRGGIRATKSRPPHQRICRMEVCLEMCRVQSCLVGPTKIPQMQHRKHLPKKKRKRAKDSRWKRLPSTRKREMSG